MRTLLIWSLLALTPFAGVRMVCVQRSADVPAVSGIDADCDQFCVRRGDRPGAPSRATVDCVLFGDGLLLVTFAGVAVLPQPPATFESVAARPFALDVVNYYLSPLLSRDSPPPKA